MASDNPSPNHYISSYEMKGGTWQSCNILVVVARLLKNVKVLKDHDGRMIIFPLEDDQKWQSTCKV